MTLFKLQGHAFTVLRCDRLQAGHPAEVGRCEGHRPQDLPAALCAGPAAEGQPSHAHPSSPAGQRQACCQPAGQPHQHCITTASPPHHHCITTALPPYRRHVATASPPHHHRIASTSPPCCHHIATALPLHHCNTCSQHCLQQWLLHVLVLVSMPKFLLLFTTSPCWVQISAIKALLGDLRGGLSKVNTEILKAAGVDANSAFAHRQFGDLMMSFHQHAKSTFSDAEVCSTIPPPSPPSPRPFPPKKKLSLA